MKIPYNFVIIILIYVYLKIKQKNQVKWRNQKMI